MAGHSIRPRVVKSITIMRIRMRRSGTCRVTLAILSEWVCGTEEGRRRRTEEKDGGEGRRRRTEEKDGGEGRRRRTEEGPRKDQGRTREGDDSFFLTDQNNYPTWVGETSTSLTTDRFVT